MPRKEVVQTSFAWRTSRDRVKVVGKHYVANYGFFSKNAAYGCAKMCEQTPRFWIGYTHPYRVSCHCANELMGKCTAVDAAVADAW